MYNQHTPQVVVISDREDAHIPYVQAHLAQPMHVIDPLRLIEHFQLSFTFQQMQRKVTVEHADVRLDRVAGIWYRKPQRILSEHLPVKAEYKEYSLSALREHMSLVHAAFQDATWISDSYAIWKAGNKNWQMEVARQFGLHVPTTLITSDKQAAKKFINQHGRVIVKPLANVLPIVKGVPKTFFTTIIHADDTPNLDQLHLAPAIFQQLINPVFEIRATVVGDKVFAAAIYTKNTAASVRDWRALQFDKDAVQIAPVKLPQHIAKSCAGLVKALGLAFGAIDFIVDKKGRYWFLENNPNGQWAFIEKATHQPIGRAIAELLVKTGSSSPGLPR